MLTIPPSWGPAFVAAREAPLTVVVGPTDAGKTTLVAALTRDLAARGLSVAVVDADLGQSEIGPPTTVGLGRVTSSLRRLREAEVLALHFVGVTSPSADVLGVVVGTRRLVDRARALGFQRVVVDTSGLVAGPLGRWLKRAKIDLLGPDLLVALQGGDELQGILRAYDGAFPPRVVRLPALTGLAPRGPGARRRHREQAFDAHLAGAAAVDLDLRRVVLRHPPLFVGAPLDPHEIVAVAGVLGTGIHWGERQEEEVALVVETRPEAIRLREVARTLGARVLTLHPLPGLVGAIAGLDDTGRDTVGLGVVERLDVRQRILAVRTSVPPGTIAAITIGRARLESPSAGHGRPATMPRVEGPPPLTGAGPSPTLDSRSRADNPGKENRG